MAVFHHLLTAKSQSFLIAANASGNGSSASYDQTGVAWPVGTSSRSFKPLTRRARPVLSTQAPIEDLLDLARSLTCSERTRTIQSALPFETKNNKM